MYIIIPVPSMAINNGYASIVYDVKGLQNYTLHWNDRFPPGSIINIYAEANGINHRREVAVDYIFIIKDPNGNIVDTTSYSNRFDDYRENDYVTYSRDIPQTWEDGAYKAEIHIFDLLNDSRMEEHYKNITQSYLFGDTRPDVPVMVRRDVFNLSETDIPRQIKNINKTFYIDRYANKYPVDRFRVENFFIDKTNVAPEQLVQVTANVINTFYEKGSTSVSLLMDNKEIESRNVEIEGYSSQPISFTFSSNIVGNHSIEILPTGENTMGLKLSTVFNVVAGKPIEVPTDFQYKDLQIDRFTAQPGAVVTVSVIVENKGKDGNDFIEFYINDVLEEERDVHLNFSETGNIKFNISKEELGAYRVTIGKTNLSKIFFVEPPSPTVNVTAQVPVQSLKEKKPNLKIVLGLSVLAIFLYVLRIYLKKKFK